MNLFPKQFRRVDLAALLGLVAEREDAEHAELLHCKKGLPVMDITSRGVLRDGRIFVYSRIKAVQYECTYVSPFNKDVFLSRRKIITEDA